MCSLYKGLVITNYCVLENIQYILHSLIKNVNALVSNGQHAFDDEVLSEKLAKNGEGAYY